MSARLVLVFLAILLAVPAACANVTVPDVISNSMVLQHDQIVPIWGTADPGETVVVKFASQTQTAQAGADGKWQVTLKSMSASITPSTMTISGNNTITLDDVLVGEVWIVSGQSNMQFTLAESADGQAAIAAANDPAIRLFNISRKVAFQHESGPLALWQAVSPESVRGLKSGMRNGRELRRNTSSGCSSGAKPRKRRRRKVGDRHQNHDYPMRCAKAALPRRFMIG